MKKVFIDGSAGTTGLRIFNRLGERTDIELITLSEELRKDQESRRAALNAADIVFLCLPDDASREAISMITNPDTVVLDTSTAHRTLPEWTYGFPELTDDGYSSVKNSKRIAVPGCHASGFIALVKPLIDAGVLSKDARLTCHSVTGYSGGGKKMIAQYEGEERCESLSAPRQYALTQSHKHLKEMKAITGLENSPIFCPIVSDFYSGMMVTVPIFASDLQNGFGIDDVKTILKKRYTKGLVKYEETPDQDGMLSSVVLSGSDAMRVAVYGNEERILLTAVYDNLGKGASGAAVQCMNLVMDADESMGLEI